VRTIIARGCKVRTTVFVFIKRSSNSEKSFMCLWYIPHLSMEFVLPSKSHWFINSNNRQVLSRSIASIPQLFLVKDFINR
jgi:hypothetical protein